MGHHTDTFGANPTTLSPTPTSLTSTTLQPTPSAYTLQPTPSAYTPNPTPTGFNPDIITSSPTVDNSSWSVGDTAIVVSLAVIIAIGIIAYLYFADSQAKQPSPTAVTSETSALLSPDEESSSSSSSTKPKSSVTTDHDDEPIEP